MAEKRVTFLGLDGGTPAAPARVVVRESVPARVIVRESA